MELRSSNAHLGRFATKMGHPVLVRSDVGDSYKAEHERWGISL